MCAMSAWVRYPRIQSVMPLAGRRLLVAFRNGVTKVYDCTPLLARPAFAPLADEAFFRGVGADPHGYGVVWNDDVDLAESELWENGVAADVRESSSAPPVR